MSRNRTVLVLLYLILTVSFGVKKDPPMKSLVFVGTTGMGKSTTANSIIRYYKNIPQGTAIFNVSDNIGSCTDKFQEVKVPEKNIRLIDSPGFGDTNYDEGYIDQLMKGLTSQIVGINDKISGMVDAFILVVKLSPRPATLKTDLQHLRSIFGSISYKSLILLVIDTKERSTEEIYKGLENECKELMKPLLAQKNGTSIRDFTVVWGGVGKPRGGQFEELMQKVDKVEPYTHQKFLDAQQEIKDAIDERIKEEMEKEKKILQKEFADNKAKMDEEIAKMKAEKEEEKQRMLAKQEELEKAIRESQNQKPRTRKGITIPIIPGFLEINLGGDL